MVQPPGGQSCLARVPGPPLADVAQGSSGQPDLPRQTRLWFCRARWTIRGPPADFRTDRSGLLAHFAARSAELQRQCRDQRRQHHDHADRLPGGRVVHVDTSRDMATGKTCAGREYRGHPLLFRHSCDYITSAPNTVRQPGVISPIAPGLSPLMSTIFALAAAHPEHHLCPGFYMVSA